MQSLLDDLAMNYNLFFFFLVICGGSLVADVEPKTVSSPFYPKPYRSKLDCVWIITAPSTNDSVLLRFTDMESRLNVELRVSSLRSSCYLQWLVLSTV